MLRRASQFLVALLVSAAALGSGVPITPFPTPLTANAPAGSLIYGGSTTGAVSFAGDAHEFTLSLDAGQVITVDVVPAATLQPRVVVRNPSSFLIATTTASAAGQEAVIQTVAAATAGTYTFTVDGVGGTTGTYTLKITLNAALESENHGGPSNGTAATAQDLNSSAVALADPSPSPFAWPSSDTRTGHRISIPSTTLPVTW